MDKKTVYRKNPFAEKNSESITLRISKDTLKYFRKQSESSGIPFETLINHCLAEKMLSNKQYKMQE